MAVYRRVYDSRHLQVDCQEPGSVPEIYARYSSMSYIYLTYPKRVAADVWHQKTSVPELLCVVFLFLAVFVIADTLGGSVAEWLA